jgi:predicted 2-oxoglutarate/Fe(II)-dependent dioxygenase YbiX
MPPPEFFRGFGVFVERGFLSDPDLSRVRAAVLEAPGTSGEISKSTGTILDTTIRDVTDVQVPRQIASLVEARVCALRQRLEAYFGSRLVPDLAVSFLRYGPNGHYRAHRDRAGSELIEAARRLVSVVLFLNDARSEVGFRGGQLRLYGLMGTGPHEHIGFDMEPEAGTLIAFDSTLMHEVVEISQGVRCAAACWFLEEAPSEAGQTSSR